MKKKLIEWIVKLLKLALNKLEPQVAPSYTVYTETPEILKGYMDVMLPHPYAKFDDPSNAERIKFAEAEVKHRLMQYVLAQDIFILNYQNLYDSPFGPNLRIIAEMAVMSKAYLKHRYNI